MSDIIESMRAIRAANTSPASTWESLGKIRAVRLARYRIIDEGFSLSETAQSIGLSAGALSSALQAQYGSDWYKGGAASLLQSKNREKARKAINSQSSEDLSQRGIKAALTLGRAGCQARTQAALATLGVHGLAARHAVRRQNIGDEGLSEISRKINATLGVNGRKLRASTSHASRRSNIGRTTSIGVYYHDHTGKWCAVTPVSEYGKKIYIGEYDTRVDAESALADYRSKYPYDAVPITRLQRRISMGNDDIPGITFQEDKQKWRAQTTKEEYDKRVHIGYFSTKEQAIIALDAYKRDYPVGVATTLTRQQRRILSEDKRTLGVTFDKESNRWRVRTPASEFGSTKLIGYFDTEAQGVAALERYRADHQERASCQIKSLKPCVRYEKPTISPQPIGSSLVKKR